MRFTDLGTTTSCTFWLFSKALSPTTSTVSGIVTRSSVPLYFVNVLPSIRKSEADAAASASDTGRCVRINAVAINANATTNFL